MGTTAGQCKAALEPTCKQGELPAPCEPCVAVLEDDRVFVDPASYWHNAVSGWDEADGGGGAGSERKPGQLPSSSSSNRSPQKPPGLVNQVQVSKRRDGSAKVANGPAAAPVAEA